MVVMQRHFRNLRRPWWFWRAMSNRRDRLEAGGADAYSAPAVHFDQTTLIVRASALSGSDSPAGIISTWVKFAGNFNAILFLNNDVTFSYRLLPSEMLFVLEAAPEDFNSYVYGEADLSGTTLTEWFHFLVSWDFNFAPASRRVAVYINDAPVSFGFVEDAGAAFSPWLIGPTDQEVFGRSVSPFLGDFADYGMWLGSGIAEADNTITEVNRRKFISAAGKPVDPSNWPASPLLKFSGDAASFATNQGSGGAFTVSAGALTDAGTSPSDE
jgi:hypothetical protein